MRVRLAAGLAALAGGWLVTSVSANAPTVDSMLSGVLRLDRSAVEQVKRGQTVTTSLPGALDREILAAGAIRIWTPADRVLDLFRDIEQLERGKGFLQTVQLSEPPLASDFDTLKLPAEDVLDLRRCRIGECKLQMPQRGFDLLAGVNWAVADPTAQIQKLARQLAFDIVRAYRSGGAQAISPTLDHRPPRDVAGEFAQMMRNKPFLDSATPGLSAYLTQYPRGARPEGLEEYFYWSLVEFGLKQTLRLNHIVIYPLRNGTGPRWVLGNRQIWASHYFQNAVEVRLLVDEPPQPARAHYLIVFNLARPDGVTGVFGPIVRYKVRSGSREALRKTLDITKRLAESGKPR